MTSAQRGAHALATAAFGAVVGGLVAIILVALTATANGVLPTSACGPSRLVRDAAFDPWTGQPRGQVIQGRCMDREYADERPVPPELVGRTGFPWASAMTLAFAVVGLAVGWTLLPIQRLLAGRPPATDPEI
jgi:hypothetical protein